MLGTTVHHVTYIGDPRTDQALRKRLAGVLEIDFAPLDEALRSKPNACMVVDVDLTKDAMLLNFKEWLSRKPADAKAIFLIDRGSRLQHARACALGATDTIQRPLDGRELLTKLWGSPPEAQATQTDIASLSKDPANPAIRKSPAVSSAIDTLESIFSSACLGETPNAQEVNK